MKLIAVYHQNYRSAPEVAEVLRNAGLHPSFDDLPRYSLKGESSTTPMYVPEDEAEQARKVLSDWSLQNELRIKSTIQGWWRPLILPRPLV